MSQIITKYSILSRALVVTVHGLDCDTGNHENQAPIKHALLSSDKYCFFIITLKAPITTAADDIHIYFFIVFRRKKDSMFQVDRGFT